jgi:peptidoglycan hydrolase CwlO-like protein
MDWVFIVFILGVVVYIMILVKDYTAELQLLDIQLDHFASEKLQLIAGIEKCDEERAEILTQMAEIKGAVKGLQTHSDELEKEVNELSKEEERRGKFRL